ncbi:MAG: tyrosine-type recombinase/integrase [Spirochaetales bacterium]|jgi:integrase/recombinase XerD|nr:tyrosine-type recombinase/integrase [Spirochaetales bacterium]
MRKKAASGLPQIYEDYLTWYAMRLEPCERQVKMIRPVLLKFYAYLQSCKVHLNSLRIEEVDGFFNTHYLGCAHSTKRLYRTFVRGFLSYLYHERQVLKKDLAPLVVGAPSFSRSKPPRFLRKQEVNALFFHTDEPTPSVLITNALVCLSYALGLRPKEIRQITLDNISFVKEELIIAERKCGNPLILPLPAIAIKMIAAYIIGARPESEYRNLFLSFRRPHRPLSRKMVHHYVKKRMQQANIIATPYTLRHTYAQNLLEAGVSLYEIKEMMGHDSIESTRKYLHVHIKLMREVLFDEPI